MLTTELLTRLVYLDRDFIAGAYEVITGQSPSTQITKTQGKKAGASLPIFAAEVSAGETRTFPISTIEMFATVLSALEGEPRLELASFHPGMSSKTGWVDAELTTLKVATTKKKNDSSEFETLNAEVYFALRNHPLELALIITPEYFTSGLEALARMHDNILKELSIPVRALVRVVAAESYFKQWVAIPYAMLERRDG